MNPNKTPLPDLLLPPLVAVSGFFVYMLTLQPAIGWGDSAKLALLSIDPELAAHQGYHNLRNLIGHLFGYLSRMGDRISYARTQNMVSAIFGSLSLAVLYMICRRLEWSRIASGLTCLALGTSHIFWHLSVITESYTLTIFLFLSVIYCVLCWTTTSSSSPYWLVGATFLTGLGLNNSMLFLFLFPSFAILLYLKRDRCSFQYLLPGMIGSFLLGSGLLITLYFLSVFEKGLINASRELFQPSYYQSSFFLWNPLQSLIGCLKYFAYLFYQFPLFGFLLGGFGGWLQWKYNRSLFWFLCPPFVLTVLFTSTYMAQRKFFIMSLSFAIFAIWIGEGTGWLIKRARQQRHEMDSSFGGLIFGIVLLFGLSPVLLYTSVLSIDKRITSIELYSGRDLPYRQDRAYFLQPWKMNHDYSEQFWNDTRKIPGGSILIADFTPAAPLRFYRAVRTSNSNTSSRITIKSPNHSNFQNNPTETVNHWIEQLPEDRAKKSSDVPIGVYTLNSHPVYQKEKLETSFLFRRPILTETGAPEKKQRLRHGGFQTASSLTPLRRSPIMLITPRPKKE